MPSTRHATMAQAQAALGDDASTQCILDQLDALIADCGGAELRVAPTMISWARRRGFAYLWRPRVHLDDVSVRPVVSLALTWRDEWPQWKEVVEVRPGLWMHHRAMAGREDVDDHVAHLLPEACAAAGSRAGGGAT